MFIKQLTSSTKRAYNIKNEWLLMKEELLCIL